MRVVFAACEPRNLAKMTFHNTHTQDAGLPEQHIITEFLNENSAIRGSTEFNLGIISSVERLSVINGSSVTDTLPKKQTFKSMILTPTNDSLASCRHPSVHGEKAQAVRRGTRRDWNSDFAVRGSTKSKVCFIKPNFLPTDFPLIREGHVKGYTCILRGGYGSYAQALLLGRKVEIVKEIIVTEEVTTQSVKTVEESVEHKAHIKCHPIDFDGWVTETRKTKLRPIRESKTYDFKMPEVPYVDFSKRRIHCNARTDRNRYVDLTSKCGDRLKYDRATGLVADWVSDWESDTFTVSQWAKPDMPRLVLHGFNVDIMLREKDDVELQVSLIPNFVKNVFNSVVDHVKDALVEDPVKQAVKDIVDVYATELRPTFANIAKDAVSDAFWDFISSIKNRFGTTLEALRQTCSVKSLLTLLDKIVPRDLVQYVYDKFSLSKVLLGGGILLAVGLFVYHFGDRVYTHLRAIVDPLVTGFSNKFQFQSLAPTKIGALIMIFGTYLGYDVSVGSFMDASVAAMKSFKSWERKIGTHFDFINDIFGGSLDTPEMLLEQIDTFARAVKRDRSLYDRAVVRDLMARVGDMETVFKQTASRRLIQIADDYTQNYASFSGNKPEPVGLWIHGDAGVGKSYFTSHTLPSMLFDKMYNDPEVRDVYFNPNFTRDECFDRFCYSRNTVSDFWDGYRGQPLSIVDDSLQSTDKQITAKSIQDMVMAISPQEYPLTMAALDLKESTFFTSPFVCCSSNIDDPAAGSQNVQCPEAPRRRFHIYTAYLNPMLCNTELYTKYNGQTSLYLAANPAGQVYRIRPKVVNWGSVDCPILFKLSSGKGEGGWVRPSDVIDELYQIFKTRFRDWKLKRGTRVHNYRSKETDYAYFCGMIEDNVAWTKAKVDAGVKVISDGYNHFKRHVGPVCESIASLLDSNDPFIAIANHMGFQSGERDPTKGELGRHGILGREFERAFASYNIRLLNTHLSPFFHECGNAIIRLYQDHSEVLGFATQFLVGYIAFQAFAAALRWASPPPPVETQSRVNQNVIDAQQTVDRMVYKMVISSEHGEQTAHALRIGFRTFTCPKHYFLQRSLNITQCRIKLISASSNCVYEFYIGQFKIVDDRDLMFFKLPHHVTVNSYSQSKSSYVNCVMPRDSFEKFAGKYRNTEQINVIMKRYFPSLHTYSRDCKVRIKDIYTPIGTVKCFDHGNPTTLGDCGLPLLMNDSGVQNSIIFGLHFAMQGTQYLGAPLFREDCMDALRELGDVDTSVTPCYTVDANVVENASSPVTRLSFGDYIVKNTDFQSNEKCGSIICSDVTEIASQFGVQILDVSYARDLARKGTIDPDVLVYGLLTSDIKVCTDKGRCDIPDHRKNPYLVHASISAKRTGVDPELSIVLDDVAHKVNQFLSSARAPTMRVFSVKEVLDGDVADLPKLPARKSVGIDPFGRPKWTMGERAADSGFRANSENFVHQFDHHSPVWPIKNFLKDEPIKWKKLMEGRTRIIASPNSLVKVAERCFLGDLAISIYQGQIKTWKGFANCVNPVTKFGIIADWITEIGGQGCNYLDVDIKGIDVTLSSHFTNNYVDFVCSMYRVEDRDRVRRFLIARHHSVNFFPGYDKKVMVNLRVDDVSSGKFDTSIENTYCSILMAHSAVYMVLHDKGLSSSYDPNTSLRVVACGDDVVLGVSDYVKTHVTPQELVEAYAKFGITATPGDKKEDMDYKTLDRCVFLKRNFDLIRGPDALPHVSAKLNMASVMKRFTLLPSQHSENHKRDILGGALLEVSRHGYSAFSDFVKQFRANDTYKELFPVAPNDIVLWTMAWNYTLSYTIEGDRFEGFKSFGPTPVRADDTKLLQKPQ